jgi:tricorn protease
MSKYLLSLSLVCSVSAVSQLSLAQTSFETKPDIHGDRVVFTAEGDLWIGSLSTKAARRLTSDPGVETNARFSPDGNWVAFTAGYDGGSDVYLMPIDGGAPKRLTYDPAGAEVQGWTPDGKGIVFRSRRGSGIAEIRHLFVVSPEGGPAKELPIPRADFGSYGENGEVAYVPTSFEWANWYHYQGGSNDQLWLADTKHGAFKRLTEYKGVDTTPVWCGNKVFFVSERSGWQNLWEVDPSTKTVKQCTFYSGGAVRYPGSDGHRVIFQHGAHLGIFDPSTGKADDLSFNLSSDRIHEREQRIPVAGQVTPGGDGAAIGPTGKRILIEARGQILSVATENGDMRILEKKEGTRARLPLWSPDGKHFAFISDRSGENELWIGSADGGVDPAQLTHGLKVNAFKPVWSPDGAWIALQDREGRVLLVDAKGGSFKVVDTTQNLGSYDAFPGSVAFSPDSKLLAYVKNETNWNSSAYIYEIASGKDVKVTDDRVNVNWPIFDTTGKFLIYLADDSINPQDSALNGKYFFQNQTRVHMIALTKDAKSPFLPKDDEEGTTEPKAPSPTPAPKTAAAKPTGTNPPAPVSTIDWDGLADRVIAVPLPAGTYTKLEVLPGKILAFGSGTLTSFDLDGEKSTTIIEGISDFEKSYDGKKLLFTAGRSVSVHPAETGPTSFGAGIVNLTPYSITFRPVPEWHQIFEESWRIARDFFYDPNMHGLDWTAVRRKYEAELPMVGDRADLGRMLRDMVSELNIGHAYIGLPPSPPAHAQAMGFLGIDVSYTAGVNAAKITKIYRGDIWSPDVVSPLAAPGTGVKEGDYILEIAGQPVTANTDIQALLLGTRGETVALLVNDKPSRDGAKVLRVKPLDSEAELRYQDWVMGRTKYVEDHGGPNFGYLHIPDMGHGGLVGFVKGQFPDVYKTAMIYDERYNGGGYVSSLILQDIGSKPVAWFKPRIGNPWTREGWANIGHKTLLINQYCFSDGELVVETWKRMKLGPVIGVRTGGGEVGSGGGYELIDQGSIYVPNYGAYVNGEWIVEGHGATPDIDVEEDPASEMAGRDTQLDKAIEVMKGELEKDPISIPQHPPFPIKAVPETKPGG